VALGSDISTVAGSVTEASLTALAKAVKALGTAEFHECLSTFVAQCMGTNLRLAIHYSAVGAPAFAVNSFMTPEAVGLYLDGVYRIDPLLRIARTLRGPQVVRLRAHASAGAMDNDYLEEIFKFAYIFDELAFLLPALGRSVLAICCDRRETAFTDAEQTLAESMLPLVDALHRRHVIDVLRMAASQGGSLDDAIGPNRAVSIVDRSGRPVYATPAWNRIAGEDDRFMARIAAADRDGHTQLALDAGHVLHWETLGPLPDAMIVSIETDRPGRPLPDAKEALARFCRDHGLTPREAEVVGLVLQGYPNGRIAERLGLTSGTVKNHRWRLYYKLDITTERELFLRFLATLMST
jgi:DNA-binding CsgD family transcriptional regulator